MTYWWWLSGLWLLWAFVILLSFESLLCWNYLQTFTLDVSVCCGVMALGPCQNPSLFCTVPLFSHPFFLIQMIIISINFKHEMGVRNWSMLNISSCLFKITQGWEKQNLMPQHRYLISISSDRNVENIITLSMKYHSW